MSFYNGTVSVCKNMCDAGAYVDGDNCPMCPTGRFYNSSTLACVECPADQYQDEEGQLACKNPPANVFGMNDVHDDKTRVCPYTTTHYRDSSGCHACEDLGLNYICQKRMPTAIETKTERNKV